MTSNAGAKMIAQSGAKTLGFSADSGETASEKKIREAVMGELKNVFRPEFLNRVDDIIVFRQLTKENIDEIAKRMLASLSKRVRELDFEMEFTDEAVAEIGKAGFDPVYGARPLRRAIQQQIEDKLSEEMLEGKFTAGKKYMCTYGENGFVFSETE
jgi:ATP-dependent Clp protease ATP-binding subunit ClpC